MQFLILALLLFPFTAFVVNEKYKYIFTLGFVVLLSSLTTYKAIDVFIHIKIQHFTLPVFNKPVLVFDMLSSFFILIVNFTAITGILYAKGYLRGYSPQKTNISFSIHYISYMWLHLAMILVCLLRDGFHFMIAWELMTISSFLLIIFEGETRSVLRTGISYLIQMHIGLIFIMTAFFVTEKATGEMNFDALGSYFTHHSNILIFLLFFIGFAIKAGFIPFHTWLPEAHPAAPSHISGVMSGVMIKMGIYGIFRISSLVFVDASTLGAIILVVSIITGLYGIMFAIVQHDLKKLLAYSSIENIGIIGIGIGLGLIGVGHKDGLLILLGFGGSLMHVFNHSLYKSLLFYLAGSVYKATHTRNIEQLGGLIKKMPKTSILFLIGSLAICGLPPFNGFISEYLIFSGLFSTLDTYSSYSIILYLTAIIALALIGGLALFTFTKAFGLAFLGETRRCSVDANEVSSNMFIPKFLIVIVIICIGFFPVLFVKPAMQVVVNTFTVDSVTAQTLWHFWDIKNISIISGIFVLLVFSVWGLRHYILSKRKIDFGPTWGCGYTASTPSHQYTSTSYISDYTKLARPVVKTSKYFEPFKEDEIFPKSRTFKISSVELIKQKLIDGVTDFFLMILRRLALLQTGKLQDYVLYALLFMFLILALSFFKLI